MSYWWKIQKERDHSEDQDSIKIYVREMGWSSMDWINLTRDRDWLRALMNMIMNLPVPWNVGKFLSSCRNVSLSRRAQFHEVSLLKELLYQCKING
jgi:hypothetical protein